MTSRAGKRVRLLRSRHPTSFRIIRRENSLIWKIESETELQLVDLSVSLTRPVSFMGDPTTVSGLLTFSSLQAGWWQMWMLLILLVFLGFSYLLFHSMGLLTEDCS